MGSRSKAVQRAGLVAAGSALALTLCPAVEERKHIDVPEYVQVNAVSELAVPQSNAGAGVIVNVPAGALGVTGHAPSV